MLKPNFHEISAAKNILSTARDLMDMESAVQQAAREKDLYVLDAFVRRRTPAVPPYEAGVFKRLEECAKQRMATISGLSLRDDELFGALFGIGLPADAGIAKKPYVVQWSLRDGDYELTCSAAGMKPCYAESDGLCLAPDDIKPAMRKTFGDSVTMVRATKKPVIGQKKWPDVKSPIMGTDVNSYAHTSPGLKRLPVTYEEMPDPLCERHEELHGYQRMLVASGYTPDTDTLERDLFEEEAADCIAEAEMGIKQPRQRLVHTTYFDEHDLEECRRNLAVLARKMSPNNPADARRFVPQRDRNEYALFKVYESGNNELKKLVGWALHVMEFYSAHRIIPTMQTVYEAQ